jgi:D-alanine transaminase
MDTELLYLNGAFLPLSEGRVHVEDRGFQLGDSVYEVVRVLNGHCLWLEDHLERLARSLGAIRLERAIAGRRLDKVIPDLVRRSGMEEGAVYIQITRGAWPREFLFPESVEPTVLAYVRNVPRPTVEAVLSGEAVYPVVDSRWAHCEIKSTNLLAAVLAKEEAREAGAEEALFVAPDGTVREGGSSNFFAVLKGAVRTHPVDNHILGGITRRHLLELAEEAGFSVEEKAFTLAEITESTDTGREVFLASTLKDVMPVVRVGDHLVGDGRPGRITLALADIYRRRSAVAVGAEPPVALS